MEKVYTLVYIQSQTNTANITGLIYATDGFRIDAYGVDFSLTGGIYARDIEISSLWQNLTINYNPDLISRTIAIPISAPIINIEHWEEEY